MSYRVAKKSDLQNMTFCGLNRSIAPSIISWQTKTGNKAKMPMIFTSLARLVVGKGCSVGTQKNVL